MLTIRRRFERRVALALGALTLGCAQGVTVASYPVPAADVAGPGHQGSRSAYWSAFVEIEGQDIGRLWRVRGLDFVLITAQITLPAAEGPLVRSVPLFTVERGMVKQEGGVDLLQKLPLHADAREQMSFRVSVTLLKDVEALRRARKILDVAQGLAQPLLQNYPLASRILESALPLIDEFAQAKDAPTSSATTAIGAGQLANSPLRSGRGDVLLAYFLRPMADVGEGGATSKQAIEQALGMSGRVLEECSDKEGFLCLAKEELQTRLRAELQALDAAYDHAAQVLYASESHAGKVEACGAPSVFGDLNAVPQELKGQLIPTADALCTWWEGARGAYDEAASPHYVRVNDALTMLGRALERLAMQARARAGAAYLHDRVDGIAYLTIKFRRTQSVHDPRMILHLEGGSCDSLTEARIDEVDAYLTQNQALFLPEHLEHARENIVLGRDYLALRALDSGRRYAEILERFARQYGEEVPLELAGPGEGSSSELDEAWAGISSCIEHAEDLPPLRELRELARQFLRRVPGEAPDARQKRLADALEAAGVALGESSWGEGEAPRLPRALSEAPIARLAHGELMDSWKPGVVSPAGAAPVGPPSAMPLAPAPCPCKK